MRSWTLFILLAAAGCGDKSARLNQQELERLEAVGEDAANALKGGLMQHLGQALQQGGAVQAVSFCSGEALSLTDSIAADVGPGIQLKRASLRFRNPSNAPDEFEIEALRHFEGALQNGGDLPSYHTQQVSANEFRYYQPLRIADPCLQCHGNTDQVDSEVAQHLAEKYPDDRATGYAPGDLRGVIRVSIDPAALRR